MSEIKVGDLIKMEKENRVFKLQGFAQGLKHIPDGWFVEGDGEYVNPSYCKKYNGATSVLNAELQS